MTIMYWDHQCFNKFVLETINKLKNKIESGIAPENISYFNAATNISWNRDKSYAYDYTDILWDDESNINGYEVKDLKAALRYLEANRVKSITENFDFFAYKGMSNTTGDRMVYKKILPVPSGYDGRNAYVEFVAPDFSTTYKSPSLVKEEFVRYPILFQDPTTGGGTFCSSSIVYNEREIIVNFNHTNVTNKWVSGALYAKGKVTYWRFV